MDAVLSPSDYYWCGADRLLRGEVCDRGLRAARLAVVTHAAAVTADLRPTLDGLFAAGLRPEAVVTPEHGFSGCGPPGSAEVTGAAHDFVGARPIDGYNRPPEELADDLDGIEVLLVDLSDLGARCSTYLTLLDDCLAAAERLAARVVVLDRPNPLGPTVAGPVLRASQRSHVGRLRAPLRHGLTLGQSARALAPGGVDVDVIGWRLGGPFRPWVAPAPNLPTGEAALCYTGTVLFEGVCGAEPRGTTAPFTVIGAPWLTSELIGRVAGRGPAGIALRPTTMAPLSGRHRGAVMPAVALHVTDPATAEPLQVAVGLLSAAVADGVALRLTAHFDDVVGDPAVSRRVLDGWDADRITGAWT